MDKQDDNDEDADQDQLQFKSNQIKKYGFEYRIQDYKKSLMKITLDFNDELDSLPKEKQ